MNLLLQEDELMAHVYDSLFPPTDDEDQRGARDMASDVNLASESMERLPRQNSWRERASPKNSQQHISIPSARGMGEGSGVSGLSQASGGRVVLDPAVEDYLKGVRDDFRQRASERDAQRI